MPRAAALVGVNPVYGLYASIAGPVGGSLVVSAQLMQIATTSASALAAGQAIAHYPPAQRDQALFLLVFVTGIFLAIFGLLRLGRLVRFVSHAVMIGFLSGVAVACWFSIFSSAKDVAVRMPIPLGDSGVDEGLAAQLRSIGEGG